MTFKAGDQRYPIKTPANSQIVNSNRPIVVGLARFIMFKVTSPPIVAMLARMGASHWHSSTQSGKYGRLGIQLGASGTKFDLNTFFDVRWF